MANMLDMSCAFEFKKTRGSADQAGTVLVTGSVSYPVHGKARGASHRQFFSINGRPCDLPKVISEKHFQWLSGSMGGLI